MGQISILLIDSINKLCQKMLFLRNETELLICNNVNTINRTDNKSQFSISTIESGYDLKHYLDKGYKVDDSLHDRLVLDYNNETEQTN